MGTDKQLLDLDEASRADIIWHCINDDSAFDDDLRTFNLGLDRVLVLIGGDESDERRIVNSVLVGDRKARASCVRHAAAEAVKIWNEKHPDHAETSEAPFTTKTISDARAVLERDAAQPDEDGVLADIPVHPDSVIGQAGGRLQVMGGHAVDDLGLDVDEGILDLVTKQRDTALADLGKVSLGLRLLADGKFDIRNPQVAEALDVASRGYIGMPSRLDELMPGGEFAPIVPIKVSVDLVREGGPDEDGHAGPTAGDLVITDATGKRFAPVKIPAMETPASLRARGKHPPPEVFGFPAVPPSVTEMRVQVGPNRLDAVSEDDVGPSSGPTMIGEASPEVNRGLVEVLERLLADAKSGEVLSAVICGELTGRETFSMMSGAYDPFRMIGSLELAKVRIINDSIEKAEFD